MAARFMPNWVLDVSKSVVESLSVDDSELPALDIDPGAMPSFNIRASCFGSEWEDHNREDITRSHCEDDCVTTMAIESQTYNTKQHHQGRIVWSYHVFDPVLGVIPRETRDLWIQDNKTSLNSCTPSRSDCDREGSKRKVRVHLESNPTIFADETTDADNSATEDGFNIQRSLPPVRFS